MKKKEKDFKLRSKKIYSYKRKVIISDLISLMSIGIHDFEKIKKQEVKFNIIIDINPSLFPIENKQKYGNIMNYKNL